MLLAPILARSSLRTHLRLSFLSECAYFYVQCILGQRLFPVQRPRSPRRRICWRSQEGLLQDGKEIPPRQKRGRLEVNDQGRDCERECVQTSLHARRVVLSKDTFQALTYILFCLSIFCSLFLCLPLNHHCYTILVPTRSFKKWGWRTKSCPTTKPAGTMTMPGELFK